MPRLMTFGVLVALCFSALVGSHAQTLNVIYAFSGRDGAYPYAGLTWDEKGNLYGTTSAGGNTGCSSGQGCGTVFALSASSAGWTYRRIYEFQGQGDGWSPMARVVFGPDGNLYGTTYYGGQRGKNGYGNGTVFKLTPPASGNSSSAWTHTVIYSFAGGPDGATPGVGDLIFDAAGNIYGTTLTGGLVERACIISPPGCGVVFELSPSSTGWTEQAIYSFTGGVDGDGPIGGVVFDAKGNLLGTASEGGASRPYGTVFELTPSGSSWTETTLHSFSGYADGGYPATSLSLDPGTGIIFGTTSSSLVDGVGATVFQITPSSHGYSFQTDYLLPFPSAPLSALTLRNGNLYGTTPDGGVGHRANGNVFELSQTAKGWTGSFYNFSSSNLAPYSPFGGVLVDRNGVVYGTTQLGGKYSDGTIFELTP